MKQIVILIAASFAFCTHTKAQCPGHVKYSISKMEIMDTSMTVNDTKDDVITLETYEKGFTGIQEAEEGDSLHATIKSVTCNWTEPYKNGKIVMICDIVTPHDELVDATVTIEAVNGKISIVLNAKEHQDRIIRLVVDKYEEVK